MRPEPGEINTGDYKEVKLKCGPKKKRLRIPEDKMKDETGNKQNCNQDQ
jgi:hypothetical protein